MADIIGSILQFIQSPIGIIVIALSSIVLIYYILTRFFKKKDWDKFEIETFEDVVLKDLDDKFKVKGIKTNSALVQGFDFWGSVDRWIRETGKHEVLTYDPKRQDYVIDDSKKMEFQEYDLYIFRIWKTNFLFKLLGIGKKKYVIVDKKHIANIDTKKPNYHQWNIGNNVQLFRWAGIFVTSSIGEDYVSDISIKRSHENTMTFMMNYARKIIYLEMKHAQIIDRYSTKKKIDRKAWAEYKRAEDIEESDDDE